MGQTDEEIAASVTAGLGCMFTALVIFIVVNFSVVILRFTRKDETRNFKIPFGICLPIIAIAGIAVEMWFLSTAAIMWGSAWFFSGIFVYLYFHRKKVKSAGMPTE